MSTMNINTGNVQGANSVGGSSPLNMATMVFMLQTLMADAARTQFAETLHAVTTEFSAVKLLASFLDEAKAQRQAASEGRGDCPWSSHASMMSPAMASFMDTLGLQYDRYGNDLANNPREWDVAIKSLENALSGAMLTAGLTLAGPPDILALATLKTSAKAAQLAEFLTEAKAQRQAAREGRGNCPWDSHASMMSPEMATFMDSLGLRYDRTGNDLANNPREWDVAVQSLENALTATVLSAGVKAAAMPQVLALGSLKAAGEIAELAAFLGEAKARQQAARDGIGNCPWDKNASMMSRDMARFMDSLGLEYDRYGNDLANNPREWDVAVNSLEKALAQKTADMRTGMLKAVKLAAVCDFWLGGGAARFMDHLVK